MKIIINFTGEGIQPYSVEFELGENDIPKTDADWKKLALEKSNADSICLIEDFTFGSDSSSSNSITANVVLDKRTDLFASVPQELLPGITNHLIGISEYERVTLASKELTQKIRAIEKEVSGFAIFEQSPVNWRLFPDKVEQAAKLLEVPENIEKLLRLINGWIQTDQGIERFLAWIDTFHKHFVAVYNSLATPRSAEHEALLALITDNVESLNLNKLNSTAQAIAQNYPAVADSLNAMQTFLAWRHMRGYLSKNWRNTATTCYCNLLGAELQRANLVGTNLEGANLQGTNLEVATLSFANLQRANLEGANLHWANLEEANLERTNLILANLQRANLKGAKLQGANLREANLLDAKLQGADLTGVTFDEHTNLHDCNLAGAIVRNIMWPAELLSVAKASTWKILEAEIAVADPAYLLRICHENQKENHIFDVRENPGALHSFFSSSDKLTTHRKLFNDAICKRINELLQSADITPDNKQALQQLQQTINPDSAASAAAHSLRI